MSPNTKLMSSVVANIFMMLCVACQRWQKANELLDIRFLLIEITKFYCLQIFLVTPLFTRLFIQTHLDICINNWQKKGVPNSFMHLNLIKPTM